ncbi:MAG: bifunctional DNA-formamidopyrimidine glycosylase/DNA-(apurinic or apyrimidinic site) lyase [Dethiobacteria bacterium]|nr:bifunctional DNA-formamidopyrimidine glycosylase/DNA-(apurinic or apyrimidinic site) lyase [Bacillota bacterium]
MPELPEVETIKRGLQRLVTGKIISEAHLFDKRAVLSPEPALFKRRISGRRVLSVERRGKYILMKLTDDKLLVIHLRMTGQLIYFPNNMRPEKSTRVLFKFITSDELHFNDLRRFGTLWLINSADKSLLKGLSSLGPEPLSAKFNLSAFTQLLKNKKQRKIKALLLDQACIAGLGNIYTDEILYRAAIHPACRAGSLTTKEIGELYETLRTTLLEAIELGGTSTKDYLNTWGETGYFQFYLQVYGRRNQPCLRCSTPIERTVIAGRGTYFCPSCQRYYVK